jgi:purine nucleosidase
MSHWVKKREIMDMKQKILIDTDPGIDDAMAILTALHSPELEVIGLTSVYGNAAVKATTLNALRLVELDGCGSIPVACGASQPLAAPLEKPGDVVHGTDGMGNASLPLPKGKPEEMPAAQFIAEMVRAHPGEVTLLALGPLTNLALALRLDPGIARQVRQVVVMGGTARAAGNVSPVAEANIFHDPHAAAAVFGAGWPVVMVGLDVTMQVVMTRAYLEELGRGSSPTAGLLRAILPCYQQFHEKAYGMGGDVFGHDPTAAVYLLAPQLFETHAWPISVGLEGPVKGQTKIVSEGPAATVCVGVDVPGVLALIRARLTGRKGQM